MNDLQFFRPPNKETAIAILIAVAVLVAIFCAGYMLGLRNAGTGVSDNGNGIDNIREQYQHLEVNQHEITTGIQQAAGTSGAIAESSSAIKESTDAIAGSVKDAGVLIDQCQQIIGTVRNRGKKNTAAH